MLMHARVHRCFWHLDGGILYDEHGDTVDVSKRLPDILEDVIKSMSAISC